jgi:ubiquinone biosynthesis protein UbiJ
MASIEDTQEKIPDKITLMGMLADARVKGDMEEVRRLQAYLPVNHRMLEEWLIPLIGKEECERIINAVEESKRRKREQFRLFA